MLVVNAKLIDWIKSPRITHNGALRIEGPRIVDVGTTDALCARYPDCERLDAHDMLVMPGLICGHTHLYRLLARGEWSEGPRQDTLAHMRHTLWNKLDTALGYQEMRYAALLGCIEAIRHGVTTLFDQHSSAFAIPYALDAVAEAVLHTGLRAGLCYAVSDRLGPVGARRAIHENARFARRAAQEPLLAASMGLDSVEFLSNESLSVAVGAAALTDIGFHASVAQSRLDVRECRHQHGFGPIERLRRYGALGPRTILAHGVHIDNDPMSILSRNPCWVVHNPRSNMLHAVGRAPVLEMARRGIRVGIGTDGLGSDMLGEMETAYLLQCHGGDRTNPPGIEPFAQMGLVENAGLASSVFRDRVGELVPGALADIIMIDYHSGTPLRTGNLRRHLVMAHSTLRVNTAIVAGRVLLRNGHLTMVDERAISARARELSARLWSRIN